MCVIAVCDGTRPQEDVITAMWDTNRDGAGMAWREGNRVKWEKGISLERVKELAATVPMPFVMHFRIATEGGVRKSLCHPFLVTRESPLVLNGSTTGQVLFHNGVYTGWKPELRQAILTKGGRVGSGAWSDSRGLACLASYYGNGCLDWTDQRVVVLGHDALEFYGGPWIIYEGMYVSNRAFDSRVRRVVTWGNQQTTEDGHRYPHQGRGRGPVSGPESGGKSSDPAPAALPAVRTDPGTPTVTVPSEQAQAMQRTIADHRAGGGAAPIVPFSTLKAQFERGELSKNQWKKARRRYNKQMKALEKLAYQLTPSPARVN